MTPDPMPRSFIHKNQTLVLRNSVTEVHQSTGTSVDDRVPLQSERAANMSELRSSQITAIIAEQFVPLVDWRSKEASWRMSLATANVQHIFSEDF
jgi:hypothetical protein